MIKEIDFDILNRTIDSYYSLNELKERLSKKKQLLIKYGVDVTAPFLHIGHGVNLWTMRYFQECGHKVLFLIGDFTTRIGDPTGKSKLRKVISIEEIAKNAKEFVAQVGRILITDKSVFEIRYNSSWYNKMNLSDFLSLCSMVTHSKLIQRDMFQKRIENKQEIHLHEMLYPLLQGYDSVELKSDLTIVGTDQLFNELMGRFYQEKFDMAPQIIMTTKITPGTDGVEKQSKSLGNYIALEDSPKDKFGKVMSLPDFLIFPYMKVYTTIPLDEIAKTKKDIEENSLNPMIAKKILAKALVERYHGEKIAKEEEDWFNNAFSDRKIPDDIKNVKVSKETSFIDILHTCMEDLSKSAITRLIKQGAIRVNGEKVLSNDYELKDQDIVKAGKRRWYKIIF